MMQIRKNNSKGNKKFLLIIVGIFKENLQKILK